MEYYQINVAELEEEELNYELMIRGQSVEAPLMTRQRTLRYLLRTDEKQFESMMQISSRTIALDYLRIPNILREIEQRLCYGRAPECLSRLVHYHKRIRRYLTISPQEAENKQVLLELIS